MLFRPPFLLVATGLTAGLAAFGASWWCHAVIAPPAAPLSARPTPAHTRKAAAPRPPSPDEAWGAVSALAQALRAGADIDFAVELNAANPAEYPAILLALQMAQGPETSERLAMLFRLWASHDGPAALTAARRLAAEGEHSALQAAIVAWARRDPGAARQALLQAGYTDLESDEMSALLLGWGSADPIGAEAYLRNFGSSSGGGEIPLPAAALCGFVAIARARIEADPAAGLDWYLGLGDGLKTQLRQTMVAQLAATAPALANRWLAADSSAELADSDLRPLLRALRLDGFDQDFAWAQSAANPETRKSALVAVVNEEAASHLLPLGEWLAARVDDAALTPAFSAYATQVAKASPRAALDWASSLTDPIVRQQTLNSVASEWLGYDPPAAREWIRRTNLVSWDAIAR